MPKLADHDQRRRQITDAARRVIARGGLRAATFQSVAAEAGVSVRLVQYYFGSKRDVLDATRRAILQDAGTRFSRRLGAVGDDAGPRVVIRALLEEVLPLDAVRRADTMVLNAFFVALLDADDAVRVEDVLGGPGFLTGAIADQLRRLRTDGSHADPDAELLLAAATGLSQTMLVKPATVTRAEELLDRLLDRML